MMGVADSFFPADDGEFETRLHVKRASIHNVYRFSFLRADCFQNRALQGL